MYINIEFNFRFPPQFRGGRILINFAYCGFPPTNVNNYNSSVFALVRENEEEKNQQILYKNFNKKRF